MNSGSCSILINYYVMSQKVNFIHFKVGNRNSIIITIITIIMIMIILIIMNNMHSAVELNQFVLLITQCTHLSFQNDILSLNTIIHPLVNTFFCCNEFFITYYIV